MKFLLQMSQGMAALKGNIEGVGKAMRQGTALTLEMARAMNADIGSQFGVLAQQVQNLAEILGATLLPVVLPVLKQLGRIADVAQAAAKEVPGLTRAVLIASAAVGAVLVVVGALVAVVGTIGVMVPAIQAGGVSLSAGVASAGSAIATWFLPVTLAIAAVVAGVVFLRRAWESNFGGIRDFVVGAYDRVRMVFDGLRQLMGSLSNGTGQMSAELAGKLQDAGLMGFVVTVFRAYYRVREALAALWGPFSAAFDRVKAIVEPAVRTLLAAYQDLARAIGGAIASITGAAGMADVSAFRQVGQVLGKLLGIVALVGAYILRFLIGGLVGVIRIVAPVIRLVGWLGGVLVSAFRLGFQAAAKFFLPLRMLIEALRHVGRMVGIVWGVLMGEVSLGEGFRAAGESLREFLLTPLRWLQDIAAATWQALGAGIAFVAGLFSRIGGAIVAGIQRLPVVAAVRGIVAGIGALLRGERSFVEAGARIVAALARGLLAAATLPVRVVRELLGRLMGLFSGSAEGGRSAGRRIVAALAAGLAGLVGLPGRLLVRALAPLAGLTAPAFGRLVSAGQAAVGLLGAPFRWLLGVASVVWQQLAAGARIGWSLLVGLGASALDALAAPFRFLGSVASTVFGGVLSAASGLWQNFVGWAATLAAVLVSPFQPLIDAAGAAWAAIRAGAEALFGALAGIVGGWWDRAKGVFDAVRSLMSLVGEGGGAANVATPKTPPGQGTPVGAAMPTPPAPPVLPSSLPSLEPPRVLPGGPVPALAGPSLTPSVPPLPVVGVGLSPVPDADKAHAASLRGMEQAVVRTMATLVRVLEAAHAKIAAMGTAPRVALPRPSVADRVGRVAGRPRTEGAFTRTPPLVAAQVPAPVPLPVRTPPIVPAVPVPPAPAKPPAPRPRREVVERGVWGRTVPVGADRALQTIERSANAAQRARSGVRTTASEWERVGRSASRGRIDEALLGAVRSVGSTRQRGEGHARTAGDLWKTIRGPKAPEAAAAPEPAIPPAGPGPEATAAPVAPPVPRMTPPVAPSPAASDRRGGLLGVSLAALMAASTPTFVPPTEAPSAATELPARTETRDRVPEPRAELLAATRPAPSPQDASAAGRSAGDPVPALLQALIAKVDALADRPIDLTVTTRLDGREVAQAVYKDLRERKIRNYETL